MYKCSVCKEEFEASEIYEYRGAYACDEHFEEAQKNRDIERAEVMEIENHRTAPFKGLDMASDSVLGKANRQILKKQREIAKKESPITRRYERGE